MSCLQLGKIWCLRGKQTINPSQVLQAETLKHEIWLQHSIFKRVRNILRPVPAFLFSPRKEWIPPHPKEFFSVGRWKHQYLNQIHWVCFCCMIFRAILGAGQGRWVGFHLLAPPKGHKYLHCYFRAASVTSLWDLGDFLSARNWIKSSISLWRI